MYWHSCSSVTIFTSKKAKIHIWNLVSCCHSYFYDMLQFLQIEKQKYVYTT